MNNVVTLITASPTCSSRFELRRGHSTTNALRDALIVSTVDRLHLCSMKHLFSFSFQALKAVAIARQQTVREEGGCDLLCAPLFDGGSARALIQLFGMKPRDDDVQDDDMIVKSGSDPYKVAGAIAGRIREGTDAALLAKGADSAFHAVESMSV